MAKHWTSFVVLLVITNTLSNAQNWCGITCKDPSSAQVYKHTMCTVPTQPGPKCNKVVKQGLDQSQIKIVVDYHNQIRKSVASLPPLVWDPTLAKVAQRWANQCDSDHHDKCRNLENEYVGQNMAYSWGSPDNDVNLEKLMEQWVNESKFVDKKIIASFRSTGSTIGHYTQMVWRKTTRIGCGFVKYSKSKLKNGKNWDGYSNFLVCNYGPGGNILGKPVY